MKEHGYEWGTTGRSSFTQDYGVLETITKVELADNKCSKAKTTTMVRRKPGASPLLFGEFLMQFRYLKEMHKVEEKIHVVGQSRRWQNF